MLIELIHKTYRNELIEKKIPEVKLNIRIAGVKGVEGSANLPAIKILGA